MAIDANFCFKIDKKKQNSYIMKGMRINSKSYGDVVLKNILFMHQNKTKV